MLSIGLQWRSGLLSWLNRTHWCLMVLFATIKQKLMYFLLGKADLGSHWRWRRHGTFMFWPFKYRVYGGKNQAWQSNLLSHSALATSQTQTVDQMPGFIKNTANLFWVYGGKRQAWQSNLLSHAVSATSQAQTVNVKPSFIQKTSALILP